MKPTDEKLYLQRSFQAWSYNSGCSSVDVDLAVYTRRSDKRNQPPYDQTPLPLCLFEAKCINNYPSLGGQLLVAPETVFDITRSGVLCALAKAAQLPLYLVAYKTEEGSTVEGWSASLYRDLVENVSLFGVACIWPRFEEAFTLKSTAEFKAWQIDLLERLANCYETQKRFREQVYDRRDAETMPTLYEKLGLPFEKPWLSPKIYDMKPPKEQASYIRAIADPPQKTRDGVALKPRPEGSAHSL